MTDLAATLSPAQKAAATRRANRAQLAATAPAGFAEPMLSLAMSDGTALAALLGAAAAPLLARFGTAAGVLAAPAILVAEIAPAAVDMLRALKSVMASALRNEIMGKPALSSWAAVVDYCKAAHGFDREESFRVLFLDKRNQIIADEVQGRGTVDHTPVYPREVIKRALVLGATAIVLVHNHPSGDVTPSRADVQMTQQIIEIGKPLGIAVHDHIIVGSGGHASLKGLRLI